MFFSSQHSVRGDESVQQILAFSTMDQLNRYKDKLAEGLKAVPAEHSISNKDSGAMFALRTVKEDTNEYRSVVRCTLTNNKIVEGDETFINPIDAMLCSVRMLSKHIEMKFGILTLAILQQLDSESKPMPPI